MSKEKIAKKLPSFALASILLLGCAGVWVTHQAPASASTACRYGEITNDAPPVVTSQSDGGQTIAYVTDAIFSTGGLWTSCGVPFTGFSTRWLADGVVVAGPTWVPGSPNPPYTFRYDVRVPDVGKFITAEVNPCNDEDGCFGYVSSSNSVEVKNLYLGDHWLRAAGAATPTVSTHLDNLGRAAFSTAKNEWNNGLGAANIHLNYQDAGTELDGTGPCLTRNAREIAVCQFRPVPNVNWYGVTFWVGDANGHFAPQAKGSFQDGSVGIIVNRNSPHYEDSVNFRIAIACHELGHAIGVNDRALIDGDNSCMRQLAVGQNLYMPSATDTRVVRDVFYSQADFGHNPGVHNPAGYHEAYARIILGPKPDWFSERLAREIQSHVLSFEAVGLPAALDTATVSVER